MQQINKLYLEKVKVFLLLSVVVLSALWIYLIIILGRNNLSNENLWYDEAGQFWMAKGLNHLSAPLSRGGSLAEVIRQNAKSNLDPGGFTVLLHYWTKISNSVFWLRLLPFVFFVLSVVTLSSIVYYISDSIELSIVSLFFIPIVKGDLLYYAFEVRAYSMEYFGIVLSLFLFIVYLRHKTNKNLLLLNIILAIFSTSRYSFIIFALIISSITFVFSEGRLKKIKLYIPLAISFAFIYLFSYRMQLQTLTPPEYTSALMFNNLTQVKIIEAITTNLLSVEGIFSTCLIVLGVITAFYSDIKKEYRIILTSWAFLLYDIGFCILSFLGIYTWNIKVRWNLSMQMLNVVALFVIAAYLFTKIRDRGHSLEKYIPVVLLLLIFIFGKYLLISVRFIGNYFRNNPGSISANIYTLKITPDKTFFISEGNIPTWKYLNEYGSLKNEFYPKNSILGKLNEEPPSNVDYVIQGGIDDISYADEKHAKMYQDLTIYEPTHIFLNIRK